MDWGFIGWKALRVIGCLLFTLGALMVAYIGERAFVPQQPDFSSVGSLVSGEVTLADATLSHLDTPVSAKAARAVIEEKPFDDTIFFGVIQMMGLIAAAIGAGMTFSALAIRA